MRTSTINIIIIFISLFAWNVYASPNEESGEKNSIDTSAKTSQNQAAKQDSTVDLPYPYRESLNSPFSNPGQRSPLLLNNPTNIRNEIMYNTETNEYEFYQKVGDLDFRPPYSMTLQDYIKYDLEESKNEYWLQRSTGENLENRASFIPQISFGGAAFDKVFGSNTINITPQGSAELIFGFNMSRIDNPTISEKLRKTPSFTFEERIQMNVTGSIGDKMELGINYNTEATFDFENKTKLEYSGEEDEIIKKIEAGNVTLPLSGSLITGSQSLFGLKTEMQFGKLRVTNVFSQQKGETSVIEMEGGAQTNIYEVPVIEYDANKHFFLSQYFKDKYNDALANLPVINSEITITKVEVWVTNKSGNFENARNIIAFMDLGESKENIYNKIPAFGQNPNVVAPYPSNDQNNLYRQMTQNYNIRDIKDVTNVLVRPEFTSQNFLPGQDYEKIENARLLTSREYKLNSRLGYISLNGALNADEVLAVAYEFTANGKTYKVGELTTDGISSPQVLVLKMIKGTTLSPKYPTWELMMKNIYSIGAYQVNKESFTLNILYRDDETGTPINYIKEGKIKEDILLKVLNLDRLNSQLDPRPDGVFDYIEGITFNSSNGRVIFPVLEPFGEYLKDKIMGTGSDRDPSLAKVADKYIFEELYDSTQTIAKQIAEKNKFLLAGEYQSSSSSEIMLNAMNVPQGSVKVTAGGIQLTENVDYTVDYTLGRVKIINQGLLESGTPIRISLESHSLFNIQTKTMIGTHLDYRISDDFNLGGTILRLTERPLTKKVNIGDEPISNTIWGVTGSYRTESQFLTTMIDKLPLLETKEPSSITIDGEFAHLIPGQSKAISKKGISYIDDFEGTETSIDMKSFHNWKLASTPQGQENLFPEASLNNNPAYGFNRARIAWFVIDPLFLRNNTLTPPHLKGKEEIQSSHYVREIEENEIFPEKDKPRDQPANITVLNVTYYPDEKGPYNYDAEGSKYSRGIDQDGKLIDPPSRWGGIMRDIQTNDFEAANVEFIEFWLMDPFVEDPENKGGKLYFNLGNISEDVLKDSRKSFENGLPTDEDTTQVDATAWGKVPLIQSYVNAFDANPATREYQDVGLDGLGNDQETEFFRRSVNPYMNKIDSLYNRGLISEEAYNAIMDDPSNDNYHYYRGSDYDQQELGILDRYKKYNGMDGNSPTDDQSPESYPTTGTIQPDVEDINRDNTLSEAESYYQYELDLKPGNLSVGQNYITNVIESDRKNKEGVPVNWYQFKIPVKEYSERIGSIQDFKSIRFMRMFLTEWNKSVVLRFAKLDLVRSEWRKYELPFNEANEDISFQDAAASFDVLAVNIEENATKEPVSYILPPGIDRVIDPTNPQLQQLNEQSIVLKVRNLADGDARAAFKNIDLDVRQYKKLKMEVHAEEIPGEMLDDYELTAFIRLGTDYRNNYYEYEIPLEVTPPGNYYKRGFYTEDDRRIVWPENNQFDIDLEVFQQAKQARNDAMRQAGSDINITTVFPFFDGDNKVTVVGNPNLMNVKVIMIGIRNPGTDLPKKDNDELPKSGEIWMNELRLTDFRDNGGWAANARVQARLADFGIVTLAGSTSKPGFGSIEKKVNERSKEDVWQYDVSTNLELGKFFPEKAKVSIPMYAGISETFINPEYNPQDPDIPLKAALDNAPDSLKDDILNRSQDYTRRRSLNFTNVKINQAGSKPKPWDISNLSASYSYNETFAHNIKNEYDFEFNRRIALAYVYNSRPKNITPLQNVKVLKKPALKLLSDFNFYYLPSKLSFRGDINRNYREVKARNITRFEDLKIDATADRDLMMNTYFDIKFDLTRSLKLDFSNSRRGRIDEQEYYLYGGYSDYDTVSYDSWRTNLINDILAFNRPVNYNSNFNAQYAVPINKIPLLNWMSLTTRYSGTYEWIAGPQLEDIDLGNTIKNSNTIQFNNNMNMLNLYNKVGFLKEINQKYRSRQPGRKKVEMEKVTYEEKGVNLGAGRAKTVDHKLKTETVSVTVFDQSGNKVDARTRVVDDRSVRVYAETDIENARIVVEGEVEKKDNPIIFIAENTARILMGVKNVSISYSESHGTMLPGYKPGIQYFGLTNSYNNHLAPTVPYVLGWHYDTAFFRNTVRENQWLTTDTMLNTPYALSNSQSLNLRSTIEPINDLRIDITGTWSSAQSFEEFFNFNPNTDAFSYENGLISGNMSMSFITWKTAFDKVSVDNDFESKPFEDFKQYRSIIARRVAGLPVGTATNDTIFPLGYGPTSQRVLIPAFLAAYSGQDPAKVRLDPFPTFRNMLPNWRVTYDGLSKVPFIEKYLRSLSLNHTYRSTYAIGSYITNPFYHPDSLDLQGNFQTEFQINTVSINEQFSPLISVDMTWKNSLTSRFEIRKSRNLTLSMANNQLTEMRSDEIVFGAGYRFDEVEIFINQRTFKSDLNVRADFSIRDNINSLRTLALEERNELNEPTSGQRVLTLKLTADYVLSDRFNLRFFFDRVVNKPYVTLAYPTANTNVGFSVTFTLTQ